MTLLSDADRHRVEQAVAEAETRTSAEFVTVVARESDDYHYIPTLAAACLTLLLSGITLTMPWDFTLAEFYVGQVLAFLALALAFRWRRLKMLWVPSAVKRRRARRLARELFVELGLASTAARTGVLLFVSEAEHYVEIIADSGVQPTVDNAVWERIVAGFVAEVRAGRIADGFVDAIEACTEEMARHHPWTAGDRNELPNRLILL